MKHFQTDGNGGFRVSKAFMASLGVIFTILITMMGMSFVYGAQNAEINNRLHNLEKVWDTVATQHPKVLASIESRLNILEKESAARAETLNGMSENIKEIKADVKMINTKLIGNT